MQRHWVALASQSAEWVGGNTRAHKVATISNWVSLQLPHNKPRIEPKDIVSKKETFACCWTIASAN